MTHKKKKKIGLAFAGISKTSRCPGRLQSTGSWRVGLDCATKHTLSRCVIQVSCGSNARMALYSELKSKTHGEQLQYFLYDNFVEKYIIIYLVIILGLVNLDGFH